MQCWGCEPIPALPGLQAEPQDTRSSCGRPCPPESWAILGGETLLLCASELRGLSSPPIPSGGRIPKPCPSCWPPDGICSRNGAWPLCYWLRSSSSLGPPAYEVGPLKSLFPSRVREGGGHVDALPGLQSQGRCCGIRHVEVCGPFCRLLGRAIPLSRCQPQPWEWWFVRGAWAETGWQAFTCLSVSWAAPTSSGSVQQEGRCPDP